MKKEIATVVRPAIEEKFDEKALPKVFHGLIEKLDEHNVGVRKALSAAKNAEAKADSAAKKSAGWGKKKAAIEELQLAGIELAEAVCEGAKAQQLSFEFQTKLADTTKYLFLLGISSIAANRFVIRELEKRLKGASEKKLSMLARQELLSVLKQLKMQEDTFKRQEDNAKVIKGHDEMLKDHVQRLEQFEAMLKNHENVYTAHESRLSDHAGSIGKHSDQILIFQQRTSALEQQAVNFFSELDKKETELKALAISLDSANSSLAIFKNEITALKSSLAAQRKNGIGLVSILFLLVIAATIFFCLFR